MTSHRILVLEDDRTSRQLITRFLEKAGYDVIQCADGMDALRMAARFTPMVMIADVMLPDMKGTDVYEKLIQMPETKNLKCIFLTGILNKQAIDSGVDFLFDVDGKHCRAFAKPVKKNLLLSMLRDIIAEQEEEALLEEA